MTVGLHHSLLAPSWTKRWRELHVPLLVVTGILSCVGILMMISAGGGHWQPYAAPQLLRLILGCALMLLVALIPQRLLLSNAYLIYALCLGALLIVEIAGFAGMGAQRWVKLGGLNIQPSEFMKLAVILALARYYNYLHADDRAKLFSLIIPTLLVGLPAILILKQPNLGTTMVLLLVSATMIFMAGLRLRYVLSSLALGTAMMPVLWHFLHDYQKQRVLTFLDPAQDPLGAGYNIMQSIIAVGSGGMLGKGYLQGSQGQLNFLPEKHTDFVFTMFAEEFGMLGSCALLTAYFLMLWMGLSIALRCRNFFASLVAVGVVALLFFHVFINIAMVMGLLPVVGLPLPLLSYGGSMLLSTLAALGLLLNAHIHRDQR